MKGLIEALQIFLKYRNEEHPTNCDHDVLYIMGVTRDEVNDDDAARLKALGFDWNEREEAWYSFRYGSA